MSNTRTPRTVTMATRSKAPQALKPFVFKSIRDPEEVSKRQKKLWKKVKVTSGLEPMSTSVIDMPSKKRSRGKSIVTGGAKRRDPSKMKAEVDRLWEATQIMLKKENMTETDVDKLRQLIQEAVDISGRIRLLVRDKENYTDEDVVNHAKDINCLQLLFHAIVELWTKVQEPEKSKHKTRILPDMMELATDVSAVYGEVMSLFLQRFGLDIVPLLRPVHGLFYSLSIHCRYHCQDLEGQDISETRDLYNSFLSGMLGLMRSAKVLLKRLVFDQDVARQRRRLVQSSISHVIDVMHAMVKSDKCQSSDYVECFEKIGSLCTDIFFTIGKTTGISELLELGEGVVAMEPAEVLGEVAHSDIQRCTIEQRPVVLQGLEMEEGGSFVSDLFIQTGSSFNPSKKVTMKMPFSGVPIPPSAMLKVKLKIGSEWFDTPGEIIDDHIQFQCKFMQGFIATIEYMAVIREIPVTGYTYICPEDSRVRVTFPEECIEKTAALQFRLIQINRSRMFEYKEHCSSVCKAILAVSDCLKIDHDEGVIFVKPVIIHLPIPNDIDDVDSEIVLFRTRPDGDLELIPKRSAMICPSTQNCYTFQVQTLSGIAIGKVKKKHLRKNRAAVVEEYELYMEQRFICNILTLMDKSLLHVGMVKMWIEVVEKRFAKKALRRRAKEGLFEVPGSRSANLALRDEDIICIETEGNIQRMKEIPLENYFIVFLNSAKDNCRSFPVEQRKDPEGRAYGLLNYYKDNEEEQKFLHGALIDANRFLIGAAGNRNATAPNTNPRGNPSGINTPKSLGTSWATTAVKSSRETQQYRVLFDGVPVLSHQSLLALATCITPETLQNISYELGIPYIDIINLKAAKTPPVIMNFELLWKWRGKAPSKEMTHFLIRAFRVCGHSGIANKIVKAEKEKRALVKEDFK